MRRFRYEAQMSASAYRWLRGNGLLTKSEFSLPWGICDFVGVEFDPDRVADRLRLGQRGAIGPVLRVDILANIPDVSTGRTTSLRKLGTVYGGRLTSEQLRHELECLIAGRFLSCDEGFTRVQKINGWAPLHRRIVALELKVARVEDALNQAKSHMGFATESYVGLPIDTVERILESAAVTKFEKAGIGLLSVDRSECTLAVPPRPALRKQYPIQQMHVVERFWRSFVRDNSA